MGKFSKMRKIVDKKIINLYFSCTYLFLHHTAMDQVWEGEGGEGREEGEGGSENGDKKKKLQPQGE